MKNSILIINSLDQNYKDLNYNEIGAEFNFNKFDFNLDYLQEKNTLELTNM